MSKSYSPFIIGLICIALVWLAGVILLSKILRPEPENFSATPPVVAPINLAAAPENSPRRLLDGATLQLEKIGAPSAPMAQIYGVMVDNFTKARPQSGLARAPLVFELPMESGITRFLAFFSTDGEMPAKIGPVRSARPYAIDYAAGLGAAFFHIGGSPAALNKLQQTKLVTNFDDRARNKYFRRLKERKAPHNMYTDGASIGAELTRRALSQRMVDSWIFREPASAPASVRMKKGVSLTFGTPAYSVAWRFDPVTGDYLRMQAGARHLDEDGAEIHAKNIAIVFTEARVLDEVGRQEVRTLGVGEAWVFIEGEWIQGTWRKSSAEERLRFFDAQEKKIEFVVGPTWIEVVTDKHRARVTE